MASLKISTILASLLTLSAALDTISSSQSINNNQTLTSSSGVFQLGFFCPGNSSFRYLGISYNNKNSPSRIVWVANRKSPITTTTGILHLTPSGNLVISDNTKTLIWSTNTTSSTSVQLLDTGNLVVSSGSSILWQSFDHPTDTGLPGMKLGRDFINNIEWTLSSWTSDSDPSPGRYTFTVYFQNHRPPEAYFMNGSRPIWRSGIWVGDGDGWNGVPSMKANADFDYNLININATTVYYLLELKTQSAEPMLVLDPHGGLQRFLWLDTGFTNHWDLLADPCDSYGVCGNFGVCHNSGSLSGAPSINCECLRGFVRESETEWAGGCKRKVELGRGKADGFVKVEHMKLPDTVNASSDSGKRIDECRDWCLGNFSCLGYAVTSVEGGGCINWFGDLMDMRDYAGGSDGKVLYLRLAASELDMVGTNGTSSTAKSSHSKKSSAVIITIPVVSGMILLSVALFIICVRQQKGKRVLKQSQSSTARTSHFVTEEPDLYDLSNIVTKDNELPLLPFSVIANSTKNFSNETKIGEGGFGPVHKGTLPNGQPIAVKRLSKRSGQGVDEFKNEIKLIANVQHKNLVSLLGCSIEESERLLVYEYMANGSLDKFLFDPIKAVHLDWQRRIGITDGIAQGLLYLHKYSRLRIIHRDLKCSNILLDADMNPKISDFGIARIFVGNQDHANTTRVVGTYGYMSPEYAISGLFSEKSDVFSYGVLLLEVLSGKKNSDFDQVGSLPGRAWELWNNGRVSELMDPVLGQSCPLPELIRRVQVGLLCVQEDPEERPTMSSVVSFLSSESTALPLPRNVAYVTFKGMNAYSLSGESYGTLNEVTITATEPR